MSLINQVLKDLDKRGASTQIGEATIRVVHTHSRSNAFWLVAAGAAGMLGFGAAAWYIWDKQQHPLPAPVAVAVLAPPAALQAASQPLVSALPAPVAPPVPQIESVSPDPVMATGAAQTFIIRGKNFSQGATVALSDSKGRVYPDRAIREQSPEQLVIKSNFGKTPGIWTVEVRDADGNMATPYSFTVAANAPRPPSVAQQAGAPRPESTPAPVARSKAQPAPVAVVPPGGVNKQPTQISAQQQAENEFRRADQLMRQGRNTEAMIGYEATLRLDPGHVLARQTLVSLLLEKRRNADAERVLQEGLDISPQQSGFAMLLARLQVEHGGLPQALDTLLKTLPYAEKQPDYQAFVAALLQRQNRHAEAVDHYQKALQLKPQSGVWMMGMGISLRAEQRDAEAREVFKRALDSNTLNAELRAFVEQQLKEL